MGPEGFLRRSHSTAPAVVLGGDEVALAVVRDLGREGIPVLALGPGRLDPALRSRYAAPQLCADPHYDEVRFVAQLQSIGAILPQPAVLFPTHDDYVVAVARHRDRLERHYHVPFVPWQRLRALADKESQLALARTAGVDVPTTAVIRSPADVTAAMDIVTLPAVLKPSTPLALVRSAGFKAVLIERRDELEAAAARYAGCGSLLLQELVPGGDETIHIAGAYHDASSRPLALFTGRKLRQHPRGFGVTRLGESLWSEDTADLTLRLLAAAGYQGVSDVEFKRDPRDGRLKFMEINARQGFWCPLATAAGVNLSLVAYLDCIGRPCPEPRQRDGVRWADLLRDTQDSVRELRRGELSAAAWLAPLPAVRADAFLSWHDPRPAADEVCRYAHRALRRATHSRASGL